MLHLDDLYRVKAPVADPSQRDLRRGQELAAENGCASIGFPLISAGIFGYPLRQAWEVAITACRDFLNKHPEVGIDIEFAVLDDGIMKTGKEILHEQD